MPKSQYKGQDRLAKVAKRKQNSLSRKDLPARKKSMSSMATTDEQRSLVNNSAGARKQPGMFISQPRHFDGARGMDEEIVDRRSEGQRTIAIPTSRLLNSTTNVTESVLERSLKVAQGNLLTLIEDGADDETIANQVNIIDRLTARARSRILLTLIEDGADDEAIANQVKNINKLTPQVQSLDRPDQPSNSSVPVQKPRTDMQRTSKSNATSKITEPDAATPTLRSAKRGGTGATQAAEAHFSASSHSPSLSSSEERPSKRTKIPSAKAKANEESKRTTKELLRSAFPVSAPTALPSNQRTNKGLTTEEVAELSKVHTTFDESQTNKLDRHQRTINSTKGMASDRPKLPDRGLEARIRAPSDSPPELPRNESRVATHYSSRSSGASGMVAWEAAQTLNGVITGNRTLAEDIFSSLGSSNNERSHPVTARNNGGSYATRFGGTAASTSYARGISSLGPAPAYTFTSRPSPEQPPKPSPRIHPKSGKPYYPEESDSDWEV